MVFIFWFSAQPSKESSAMSGKITEFALSVFLPQYSSWDAGTQQTVYEFVETVVRKSAHFSIYGLLGFLTMFSASRFLRRRPWQIGAAFVVSVLYAASDEFHQLFVTGRSGEFRDICIDASGALLGILLMWLILAVAIRIGARRRLFSQAAVDSVRREHFRGK
jgi:VanZ family protein